MKLGSIPSSFTGQGHKGVAGLKWGVSLSYLVTEPYLLHMNSRTR